MIYLQVLKDVDDIDHLTLEKIDHFMLKRISSEKFSLFQAIKLLRHMEILYPETADIVKQTDFDDADSVYNSLRDIRDIILNFSFL